ncbi:cytochrome P450 [Jimgerdemannia flammicorona]|uniref:Cytochrome P450 n=1 Tax=Jimgerdemannia flammicorona TaxID=994334 RepID=A0A433PJH8_9FUNG|nr:cytochrome P450 [Jimgerdemannia flammicorona]
MLAFLFRISANTSAYLHKLSIPDGVIQLNTMSSDLTTLLPLSTRPILLALALVLFVTYTHIRRRRNPLRLLPSFPGTFLSPLELHQAAQNGTDVLVKLATLAQDPILRRICVSWGWNRTVVIVSDATLIRDILVRGLANYSGAYTVERSRRFRGFGKMLSGGSHIGNTVGEEWKWHRRMIAPLFQPKRIVPALLPFVIASVNRMCGILEECAIKKTEVDMDPQLAIVTLDIINKYVFGLGNDELDFQDVGGVDKLGPQFNKLMSNFFSLWPRLPLIGDTDWALSAVIKARIPLHGFINRSIDASLSRPNLLVGAVPSAVTTLAPQFPLLTDPENRAALLREVTALIFAGYQTTSHSAAFAFGVLARRKEIQDRCAREAREVFGTGIVEPESVKMEMLARLVYLNAVIKEVLRLYPPAPFVTVEPIVDIEVGGHVVPAGNLQHPRRKPEPDYLPFSRNRRPHAMALSTFYLWL